MRLAPIWMLLVVSCGARQTRVWSPADAQAPDGIVIGDAGDDCAIERSVLQIELGSGSPGYECDAQRRCLHRSPADAGIVSVGTFVHDDGCVWLGTVIGDRYFRTWTSARPALARLGWATADVPGRAALILRWLREATSLHPVERPEPGLGPVTAPRFVARADGTAEYTIWLSKTHTGTRQDGEWTSHVEYVRHRLRFAANGELREVSTDRSWVR